jgi:small GTP-binding protein
MFNPNNYDYLFKFVLIGDSGVGKSSMLLKFVDNMFSLKHLITVGIDLKIKTIDVDDKCCKLQIWDTAGQERFKTITQIYYRGAHVIIIVYDVTNYSSFMSTKQWLRDVNECCGPDVYKVLVGNKCDDCFAVNIKQVETDEAKCFADANNMLFIETSAKNNINIEKLFISAAKHIKDSLQKEICIHALTNEVFGGKPTLTNEAFGGKPTLTNEDNIININAMDNIIKKSYYCC